MNKPKIKRNDEVVIIAGAHRGKRGKVLAVHADTERILVEGVNLTKRHQRKTDRTEGGIIERESSLHYSNVMEAKRFDAKKAKKTR